MDEVRDQNRKILEGLADASIAARGAVTFPELQRMTPMQVDVFTRQLSKYAAARNAAIEKAQR